MRLSINYRLTLKYVKGDWVVIVKRDPKAISKLESLKKRGYKIIGLYGRNKNFVYIKKDGDRVATPFCLSDNTFNHSNWSESP